MTETQTERQFAKPLRLWPGVLVVALQWSAWLALPVFVPEAVVISFFGGFLGGLAVVLWWLFLSRAPWSERLGAIALMAVGLLATPQLLHVSVARGAQGMLFPMYAVPFLSLAFVLWAAASRKLSAGMRRASMAATILLACGGWMLVRTDGVLGSFNFQFDWRWTKTPEELLLARIADQPALTPPTAAPPVSPPVVQAAETPPAAAKEAPPLKALAESVAAGATDTPTAMPAAAPAPEAAPGWPGFRGPARDGVIRGVTIATDWSTSPPVELWRRAIGPGWSSFAVDGNRIYTQEQRGDDEIVACYNAATGEPVWMHRDAARFWESNGGAGPRGTPTLHQGRVYSLGATGILNALDAGSGAVVWSRNVPSDHDLKVPYWGISSSPLVVDDLVIVAASGRLAAYGRATGEPRWVGPKGGGSYASPHLLTLNDVPQAVLLNGAGVLSVAPADGAQLWAHAWPGAGFLQPALSADGDLLIGATGDAGGLGTRRLAIGRGPDGWTVQERWTSTGLKPYFNDLVVHKGHAFGFDGRIMACIDVSDGQRKWKGGRYGHGQVVLLPDQDILLVLSEEGELALVRATPDQFTELARFTAVEGKTWNHPVLVGDRLLVRNGREMVAFRLPAAR